MAQLNSLLVTGDARFLNGVTATTQASGDNSTKVATTAYVDAAVESITDKDSTFVFTLDNVPSASLTTPNTDITQYSSATVAEIKAAADAGKFIVCEVFRAGTVDHYRLPLLSRAIASTTYDRITLALSHPDSLRKYTINVDFIANTIKSMEWEAPCFMSIAANSGTNQLTLAASTKYKLRIGGSSYIFTTPPNTTYSSKAAASGGTDVSLVTTGEKYTWNNKLGCSDIFTNASSTTNMPVHSYYYNTSTGELTIKLDPNDIGNTSRLWVTMYTDDDSAVTFEASVSLVDQDTSGGLLSMMPSNWFDAAAAYKNGIDNTVVFRFNYVYDSFTHLKRSLIDPTFPLSSLKDYYDDMGGSFYIYVTK